MRIFKDLGMVEQPGSGVPRILESYGRDCFVFWENFLRIVFPVQNGQVEQLSERQQEVLELIKTNPSAIQKHIDTLKKEALYQETVIPPGIGKYMVITP